MTREDWKECDRVKREEANKKMRSIKIENALRYEAFVAYLKGGREKALALLSQYCKSESLTRITSGESIGRIERGIAAELKFYDSFQEEFFLTPTLDAGCAYDFVGKIPLKKDDSDKEFARIDVTRGINKKREKETLLCCGQTDWPFRFACVCDEEVTWYDERKTSRLFTTPFPSKRKNDRHLETLQKRTSLFVKTRRESLCRIEKGHSLVAVLSDLKEEARLNEEERCRLFVEAIFFATYKYALNIVPALSCGDLCDFIGEHNGELVRYRILTKIDRYYEEERPLMKQFSATFKYKIALFDRQTRMFKFYEWNDYHLIDDMSDLAIFNEKDLK